MRFMLKIYKCSEKSFLIVPTPLTNVWVKIKNVWFILFNQLFHKIYYNLYFLSTQLFTYQVQSGRAYWVVGFTQ